MSGATSFVEAQTHDGRRIRLLTLIDEFTRECLASRSLAVSTASAIETVADVLLAKGIPEHIRSDNGAEMTSRLVQSWLSRAGIKDALHRA